MPSARLPGREEWRKIQAQGMQRYVALGALRRAIPMTVIALLLLEIFEGGGFTAERLSSGAFLVRVAFALTVFLAGGAASTYARWKSYQSLYGDDST